MTRRKGLGVTPNHAPYGAPEKKKVSAMDQMLERLARKATRRIRNKRLGTELTSHPPEGARAVDPGDVVARRLAAKGDLTLRRKKMWPSR